MSFKAAIIASVIALAGTVSADTMITYYSYVFDYTYPQPSVQGVASDVNRPIRIDVQVVGGDSSPLDIDGAVLQAAVISSDDNRVNQVATASAVNGTNGQYLITVTPVRDGTAQIRVNANDTNGVLVAMVGLFDLTVTSTPAQASVVNVTNIISIGDTSVTNINTFENNIVVTNNLSVSNAIINNVSNTIHGGIVITNILNLDNITSEIIYSNNYFFLITNSFLPFDRGAIGTIWTVDLRGELVQYYTQVGAITSQVVLVNDTNEVTTADIIWSATSDPLTWTTNVVRFVEGIPPVHATGRLNRIIISAYRGIAEAVYVGSYAP